MQTLLIAILSIHTLLAASYTKHLHSIDTGARCLDGSPAALYISPRDPSNIIIFFEGGEFCAGKNISDTIQNCQQRSLTRLGSSLNYSDVLNHREGLLSNRKVRNPHFWNWTKVIIPYCDGSLHQGTRKSVIFYKNKTLYFRGTNNTLQHFSYLNQTYGLFNANKIIVSGFSAGGIASLIWSNYILDHSVSKNVYCVPDSGFFVGTFANPYTGRNDLLQKIDVLIDFVNIQIDMPLQSCVEQLKSNHKCFMLHAHPKFFRTPLFIVQSQYDSYCISSILSINCQQCQPTEPCSLNKCSHKQIAHIQSYRNTILSAFYNFSQALSNVGFWAPACVQHGFIHLNSAFQSQEYRIPSGTGVSLSEGLWNFIKNTSNIKLNSHIDRVLWPNNKGCSSYL